MIQRPLSVLLVVVILLVAACSGEDEAGPATSVTTGPSSTTTTTDPAPPPDPIDAALAAEHVSVVARAVADEVEVRAAPDGEIVTVLPRFDPDYVGQDGTKVEQVFLVDERAGDWLEVLLPIRPNGSTGWIRSGDVRLATHDFEIVVELGAHRMTTYEGGEVFQRTDIAVGTADTPTPGGRFFLNALMRPPDPDTVYGTYAYALSGYSDTLTSFAGGDGVIGIHGTNDPSVMGTDVSHGCIRMRNEDIEALVAVLPLGTPVEIRA